MSKNSTKEDGRPSFQFYPKDWMTDDGLKNCSLAAQGLWINLLLQMFFSPVRGALLNANKIQKSVKDLTNYGYKSNTKVIQNLLKELEDNRVFDRLENGTIINRKMYREGEISRIRVKAVNARWHTKDNTKDDTKPIHMGEEEEAVVAVESLVVGSKQLYLEFVMLTEEEYQKLIKTFGQERTEEYIKRLNDYIGSKGKKYRSHYHTILVWDSKNGGSRIIKPKDPKNVLR